VKGAGISGPVNYDLLPTHLQEGMRRYIEHHIETGSFLRAVLENDFAHVLSRADPYCVRAIERIAQFLTTEVPPDAWGSPAKVERWIAAGKRNMTGSLEQAGGSAGAAGENKKPEDDAP
jgi:hypothetical protein